MLYSSVEGGEIMKSVNIIRLYIDLVEEKKRLTIEHLQSEYGICERTLRYYQATMNEVLIVKDLQVVIINGVMQVIKAKAIK